MAPQAGDWYYDFIYDAFLWTFSVIIELFFREVHPRSTWKVPKTGPIIIVAAPHANQFVDSLILMRVLRNDAHRRVCWLIAAKSMTRPFIGWAARIVRSVPVGRALDMKKPAVGRISLAKPDEDPTVIQGHGTDFTSSAYQVGGLLVLPTVDNEAANAEILEIVSATEIRLKKPFKGPIAAGQLAGTRLSDAGPKPATTSPGSRFSVTPHVDQSAVYSAVFDKLRENGCIGIFPEGGSHDRTELLPLKGPSIVLLSATANLT